LINFEEKLSEKIPLPKIELIQLYAPFNQYSTSGNIFVKVGKYSTFKHENESASKCYMLKKNLALTPFKKGLKR
jgi:hypothetical protein